MLEEVEPEAFLADKAYDADALIEALEKRNITPVIPPKANRLIVSTLVWPRCGLGLAEGGWFA